MKKVFIAILVVSCGLWVVSRISENKTNPATLNVAGTLQTLTPTGQIEFKVNEEYNTALVAIEDASALILTSNLDEQLSSSEFKEKNSCQFLSNGGFFTTDNKHIGLFITDGNKLSEATKSSLFNGYFSIVGLKATISYSLPPESADLALQAGPVLIYNSIVQKLKLTNDEPARRVVTALTDSGKVVFIAAYSATNLFSGPKLSELGKLITDTAHSYNLKIVSAINLDGGFHSVFITDKEYLKEIPIPGSYFCIKTP
jgi:exopolysaccharide biosynthesis protein